MSEHFGDVRTGYEVDRLTRVAADLGIVRREDVPVERTAAGSNADQVRRYGRLAEELGLSASSASTGLPSLGR